MMETVVEKGNMTAAFRRVIANEGAPGIDGMTVSELPDYLKVNWLRVKEELLKDEYRPQPVLGLDIPKPDGKGVRTLGITTVLDYFKLAACRKLSLELDGWIRRKLRLSTLATMEALLHKSSQPTAPGT